MITVDQVIQAQNISLIEGLMFGIFIGICLHFLWREFREYKKSKVEIRR